MNYRKKLIHLLLRHNLSIVFIVYLLVLSACRPVILPVPTSRPTEVVHTEVVQKSLTATVTQVLIGTESSKSTPVLPTPPSGQQVTASPTRTIMQISLVSPTPGPTASSTPCPLPDGWIIYTIQPGDTLYMLANLTGVSVNDLMATNCLTSEFIKAYERLYLPKRPPVAALPPALPAPKVPPSCPSIFSCPTPGKDPLPIAAGGGNDATFVPCNDGNPKAHLTFERENLQTPQPNGYDWPVGLHLYLFACGFTHPDLLTAKIRGPLGDDQFLDVLEIKDLPNRDLIATSLKADRVMPWYPECDYQIDAYTITATDTVDKATMTIKLIKEVDWQRVMVKPQTIHPGDKLQIFYCNYAPDSTFQVELRIKTGIEPDRDTIFDPFNSWPVTVNSDGWFVQTDITPPGAQTTEYYILDKESSLKGGDKLWVIP